MIYLDNAATTAVLPQVADLMNDLTREYYGNPSSIHQAGRETAKILRGARQAIAEGLSVPESTISFTSGGSEANNTALIGYALANRDKGNHIVTTSIEHPSVLETAHYLHDRHHFDVTFVKPNTDGTFPTDLITEAVRPDTILVSVMHANNETGQLLPVKEIGDFLSKHQAAFHVDAVQTIGKIPIKPDDISADFLSASGHKFHGPKGVGFLYHRKGLKLDPLIHGGEQEDKQRAGTENFVSIAAMAEAFKIASQSFEQNAQHLIALKNQLLSELTNSEINFYQNEFGFSLPNVINLGFPSSNHDALLTKLDLRGICVSTGSACTAGTIKTSHVLESIYGENSPKLKENIRISLSELTSSEDIAGFTKILKEVL